jgi:hypothetical protein
MDLVQFEHWLLDVGKIGINQSRFTFDSWKQNNNKADSDWEEYVKHVCNSFENIEKYSEGQIHETSGLDRQCAPQ